MTRNNSKSRYTYWQGILSAHEKSGLSQTEFCKQQNIVLSQFTYYRGQLTKKDRVKATPLVTCVPIQITPSAQMPAKEMRVLLPNGFQCVLPCFSEVAYVKKLMEALLSC